MAFTGIAALAGAASAGTAITATMVLAAVAEVGMVLTLAGGITGNKKLMKIGGAMSLIGGVGGMIAGGLGGGAAAAGEAASSTLSSGIEGAAGFVGPSEIAPALDLGSEAASAGISSAAPSLSAETAALRPPELPSAMNPTDARLATGTQQTPGIIEQASMPQLGAPEVQGAQGPAEVAGAQAPTTPADTGMNATDRALANGTQRSPGLAPEASGSFFGKFGNWVEKNPKLFGAGLQVAGGMMNSATQTKAWNEKMALETDRVKRGNSVASFQPRGIIEGARA